jgi:hypothetical protein
MESTWTPHGLHAFFFLLCLWSPCELLVDSAQTLCRFVDSLWTPHGLHADLWSPCGVHKDRWGTVKYSSSPIFEMGQALAESDEG